MQLGEAMLTRRRVDRVLSAGEETVTSQVDRRRNVLFGDPRETDPFIFLGEDWFSRVGFDWHPHRGFETVTYVVSGALEHTDNAGGHSVLRAGDLQWVTAGRGVMHTEVAHERQPVHTLQLWLNLPAAEKMTAPRYQDLRGAEAPAIRRPGVEVRVFAGEVGGVRGPARTLWQATVVDARFERGARFLLEVPGAHAAFCYVLEGEVVAGANGRRIAEGQVAWFAPWAAGSTGIELFTERGTHLLGCSAAPLREPIAAYGPFVMNNEREIREAIRDYQRGEFGSIPS